jgi:8-oxo-dGTP pyrophosphatase MutT (NUDIX family)
VLVALREISPGGELEAIFTRRTATLTKHSGQVAFPGGSMDPGDASPEITALREAHEELAIPTSAVTLLGRLDDVLSNTGFHVTPVVGVVSSSAVLTPAAAEVARVFSVPLVDLANEASWEVVPMTRGEHTINFAHFYFDGEDIWGLTAFVLMRLLELL